MRYRLLLICSYFIFVAFLPAAVAQYTYDYNARCAAAYHHYMSLQPEEGNALIRKEIAENPYNLMATYLADYEDCLLLLFNGDKADFNQRIGHMDARLNLLERGDENSPWYRLTRAGIYLHWAFVYVRMGENLKAGIHFRKSFLLLKENRKRFPSFAYNEVFWGLEQAAVGTVPDEYKWVASVLGLKGSVKGGNAVLDAFLKTHSNEDIFYREAVIFSCYLKFYLLYHQEEVWNFLRSNSYTADNLLNLFVKANIALNYRQADAALQTLKQIEAMPDSRRYPIFNFEHASALYLKLDDDCIGYYQKFLAAYKGRIFVKDSWLRMAYAYYLKGDMQHAAYCLGQVTKQGTTTVDADKQAQRTAQTGEWPNKTLLQVRLLIDGGYYSQALSRINTVKTNQLKETAEQIEYYFRLGRIYDETGNSPMAIRNYQLTADMGRDRHEYFAARALLQTAFIYEREGNKNKALQKYNECLDIGDHDYKNSIDQQAKAGVNRLTVR